MRQVTSVLAVTTLLLLAAAFAVDGAAEKLSVNRQHSHNAKRVRAKLQHMSGARGMLERRLQRLKAPEIDTRTPEMKAAQATAARNEAELKAKIADIESRRMVVQSADASANGTNVTKRETRPGINQGVEQFFDAPHCSLTSRYRVLETRFHDQCARTDFSFVKRHWYDLGRANQAYNKFCTSACAGSINDLLQYTEGYSCFESDVLTELRLFSAMCQNSPKDPPKGAYWEKTRCGAEVAVSGVFDGVQSPCDHQYTKWGCDNAPNNADCQWDRDSMTCSERITRDTIAKECSDCYVKIVDVVSNELNAICAKQDGEYCLPKLFEFQRILSRSNNNSALDKTVLDEVCKDPVMVPCYRAMDVAYDNQAIIDARKTYTRCLDSMAATPAQCAKAFQETQQGIDSNSVMWGSLCAKNSTGPNGDYCYRKARAATGEYMDCPHLGAECVAGCAAENKRFLSELGCCAAFTNYKPTTKAYMLPPGGEIKDADLAAGVADYFGAINSTAVEQCADGAKAFDWQAAECPNPVGVSEPIKFWTVLNLANFQEADAELQDKITFAMALDIGKAAGVIVTAIDFDMVAKESAAEVQGTEVAFTIKGDKALIDVAKAQWEASASHRVMTRTDEALRLCRSCKPDTEASLVPKTFDAIPGAPKDQCNTPDFFDAYKSLLAACAGEAVDAVFSATTSDLTKANAAWTTACASDCLAQFKKLKAGAYATCVPVDVTTLGDLLNVGCTEDNSAEKNKCGAVLSVMLGNDCTVHADSTTCAADAQCRWEKKSQTCKDSFTDDFLKPKCDGGCITRMAATVGMNGDSFGKEAKLLDNLFCSHDNKKLCLPMVQKHINTIDEFGLTTPVVNELCGTDGTQLRCMKRVYSAIASDTISWAEEDFYHCVDAVMDDDNVEHYNKIYQIETTCIENGLAATISAVDQTDTMLNNMCSKNKNGSLCMAFPHKYGEDSCVVDMLFNNMCPANCTKTIDAMLTDVGCCAGNLQEVYGFIPFAYLPEESVPDFEVFEDYGDDFGAPEMQPKQIEKDFDGPQHGSQGGGAGVGKVDKPSGDDFDFDQSFDDAIDSPKWYFFSNYKTCVGGLQTDGTVYTPKHHPGDLVYRKCKKVRGDKKESRDMDLGVSYETLTATPKKQKRFQNKFKKDLSVKLGLASDDFPAIGLKKNEKKSINLAPAGPGNRRATTTSASTTSIDMQASSSSDTEASASAYDTAVAEGTLTLTSTISLVKNECSNCTSAGTDYTSVSTTATAVTLTAQANTGGSSSSATAPAASSSSSSSASIATETGSGAATTSLLAAALAAVVAALAF